MKNAPNPTPDFTADPYWGKGGRYIIDADGNRVPVIETDAVVTTEHIGAATGEPRTPVADDTLSAQPAPKKGK